MRARVLTVLAGLLAVSVGVSPVRASSATDSLSTTPTLAQWVMHVSRLPLQSFPIDRNRFLLGAGLIAFSLVIFAVWGIWKFGGGTNTDADETDVDDSVSSDTDSASTSTDTGTSEPATDTGEAFAATSGPDGDDEASGATTGFERASGNVFSWSDVDDESPGQSPAGADADADSPPTSSPTGVSFDDTESAAEEVGDERVEDGRDEPVVSESAGVDDADDHSLDDARAAFDEGSYETAVEDAYTTACEALQTRYGVESAESPEKFYDRCASNEAIDASVIQHLDDLTDVHDRAVYGYGTATADEAEEALSHATAIVEGDATNTPTR